MPFVVASASALFQTVMDQVLQGLDHVTSYIDDILVTGATQSEHLKNLELVMERLRAHGIRVKCEKCRFTQESVKYFGFRVDSKGLHASSKPSLKHHSQPTSRSYALFWDC